MRFALSVALLLAGAGVAAAGTISSTTATDPTVHPALTGGTVIGFDSTASGLYAVLTIGNVKFTGVDADFTIGTDFSGILNTRGTRSVFNDYDLVPMSFRFDFTTAVDAFAFMWGASDHTWTLTAYDAGDTVVDSMITPVTTMSNAGDYIGITGSGIKYATLVGTTADYVFIDNFTYKTGGAVVPLPSSALLGLGLVGGLGGLAFLRRRRGAAVLPQ